MKIEDTVQIFFYKNNPITGVIVGTVPEMSNTEEMFVVYLKNGYYLKEEDAYGERYFCTHLVCTESALTLIT